MALSLAERLIAAKSPRARLADNEALLEDLKAEQARLSAARDLVAGESIDFALSDEDRDEAAAKAARYDRTAKAIDAELAELASLIEDRRDSEARKAKEADRAAALSERDALAGEFKSLVEPAVAAMVDLFQRVRENEGRMAALAVREEGAEAVARGVTLRGLGGDPDSYLKMKIPRFDGVGRVWPVDRTGTLLGTVDRHRQTEITSAARRGTERLLAAHTSAAERARTHSNCRLSSRGGIETVRLPANLADRHGFPRVIHFSDTWDGELPNAVIEELREIAGLKVERLAPVPERSAARASAAAANF